jgi:ADP-ribose pyrophosphatase
LESRIQASETLIVASRFTVERVDYRLGDGRLASKEVVRHPGAVVILPILPDGRLCLIKNYRVAVDQEMIELPAGTLEPNESPETTARRELIEETGYRCGKLQALCRLFMSPGILNEQMHAFLATDLSEGLPDRECGEEIDNLLVEPEEALELVKNQVITDSKTVSVLLYYFRFACEANRVSANL